MHGRIESILIIDDSRNFRGEKSIRLREKNIHKSALQRRKKNRSSKSHADDFQAALSLRSPRFERGKRLKDRADYLHSEMAAIRTQYVVLPDHVHNTENAAYFRLSGKSYAPTDTDT